MRTRPGRFLAFLALAAAPLAAQSLRVTATVPFEFFVGPQAMPAGEYTIESGALPGALYVTKSDQSIFAFALGQTGAGARSGQVKLVFDHYGKQYFLREVSDGIGSSVDRLELSLEERRIEQSLSAPRRETVVIVADGI